MAAGLATFLRRLLLVLIAGMALAGCQGESANIRYRVIAKFEVNGKPFQASSVMEMRYSRFSRSLTGAGASTRLYGEALIADLPGRKTVYILPLKHEKSGPLGQFWEYAILRTLGIWRGFGSLTAEDLARIRAASGKLPLRAAGSVLVPAFVGFRDERDPKTIFEIQPHQIGSILSGVNFKGIEIEITGDPVTEKLRSRLPWLDNPENQQLFERDPPGRMRPERELPIGHLVTTSHFFGSGSR
jgi:hypothetical protein